MLGGVYPCLDCAWVSGTPGSVGVCKDVQPLPGLSEGAKLEKMFSPTGGQVPDAKPSLLKACCHLVLSQDTESPLPKRSVMEFRAVRVVVTRTGNGRKSHRDAWRLWEAHCVYL